MVLLKNALRFPGAMAKYAGNVMKSNSVHKMQTQHYQKNGPEGYFMDDFDRFGSRHKVTEASHSLYCDENLPISRKEFTQHCITNRDNDSMVSALRYAMIYGGLPVVFGLPFWLNAIHKLPSTFFHTEEELREQGLARDLEIHIKYAGMAAAPHGRVLDYGTTQLKDKADWTEAQKKAAFNAYESIYRIDMKNVPKDGNALRAWAHEMGRMNWGGMFWFRHDLPGWMRGTCQYATNAFYGKPHWATQGYTSTGSILKTIRDHMQEDKLIKKEFDAILASAGLSAAPGAGSSPQEQGEYAAKVQAKWTEYIPDFEFYDMCNRRLIARWEENLSREELDHRYKLWCTLTEYPVGKGKFVSSQVTGHGQGNDYIPIRCIVLFQTSFFRDPGFIEDTLESLDDDVFPDAWAWSKECVDRRLEFENGPLSLQVQEHIKKLNVEEQKYIDSRQ